MALKDKIIGLAAAMSFCGIQNASAQKVKTPQKNTNKTEQITNTDINAKTIMTKFLGKKLKITEYWINSANDSHYENDARFVVYSTQLGAYIGNKAGNGYFIKSTGEVFYADNGNIGKKALPEETKLANSLYAMTGGGASNQKIGNRPIRQTQDELKLCVTKEEDKDTGDNMKIVWIAGLAGNKQLAEPTEGEMTSTTSMAFYEKLPEQNEKLLKIFETWRESIPFTLSQKEGGLTPEERGVICIKADDYINSRYIKNKSYTNE